MPEFYSIRDKLIYICALRSVLQYVTEEGYKKELLDEIINLELAIDKQVLLGISSSFYR